MLAGPLLTRCGAANKHDSTNETKKDTESSMKPLNYKIDIKAPAEKVYSTMIDKEHFKDWVSEFVPNSYFEGGWNKGDTLIYYSPDEKGNMCGMISTIQENIPNELIIIQPKGIVENGKKIFEGEKVQGLDEAVEKYSFKQKGALTELNIEINAYEELEQYFNETWPNALNRIKSISERK